MDVLLNPTSSPSMRHDSQSPLLALAPDFIVHPSVGAHSLLDEGPLPEIRQRDWFGRLAELPPATRTPHRMLTCERKSVSRVDHIVVELYHLHMTCNCA